MSGFRTDDEKGRYELYATISGQVQDVRWTEEEFAWVDGYSTGFPISNQTAVLEVKRRNEPSSKWEKEGYIFEFDKFNEMKAMQDDNNLALYINVFDDLILAWDFGQTNAKDLKWSWRKCTHKTSEGLYGQEMVNKKVTYLKKEDAIWTRER